MKNKTINNRTMQKSNLSLVLRTIFDLRHVSRKELAEVTGLTPSTVTNIVNRLLEEGYIIETGEGESDCGRKPIILEINEDKAWIVGVELSADRIIGIITGFSGEVRHRAMHKLMHGSPVEATVDTLCDLVRRLMDLSGATRESVLGIGIMSAGPYDRERGVMINSPNFKWRGEVPIRTLICDRLGIPVFFDRDSVGCAMAELDSESCHTFSSIQAVMVNTIGIGGGLIIDGEVYYGLNNCAAEIGHITVLPGGPLCGCGDAGCLEAVSTGDAILRDVRERVSAGETSSLRRNSDISMEDMIAAFRTGDPLCVDAVERAAGYLALVIDNIIKTVSPECVVLGGSFMELLPEYYTLVTERAGNRLYDPTFQPTQLFPFSYREIQSAMGAVKLVLTEFFLSLNS